MSIIEHLSDILEATKHFRGKYTAFKYSILSLMYKGQMMEALA